MITSRATVQTQQATRYILRLSKHWGHKFDVQFSESHSRIDLGDSVCELSAQEGQLQVVVQASEEQMGEMEEVVAEHLQRFAPRETTLAFEWIRDGRCETPDA